jgi:hypothetical protein
MQKKSVFLVIICLFFGAGISQLSAQSESRSYTGWWNWPFYTEVYCDGVMLGTVSGDLDFHYVNHVDKKGNETLFLQAKGHGVCDWSDETFTYKEFDKIDYGTGIYGWTYHLKGNKGSRFMGHITWNMGTGAEIIGPTSCK